MILIYFTNKLIKVLLICLFICWWRDKWNTKIIILDNFMFNTMWFLLFTQHEDASVNMFDHMMKVNNLFPSFREYNLLEKDLIFIKELIAGTALVDTSNSQVS